MLTVDSISLSLVPLNAQLLRWLRKDALPLWDSFGVDRQLGGYHEQLSLNACTGKIESSGEIRRGRVVARQIYVFDLGQRLGWRSIHSDPVHHGCRYLFSHIHQGDGRFLTSVTLAESQPQAPFSLYEQAFYLFALARVKSTQSEHFYIEDTAIRCLDRLRREWGRSDGGFEESNPHSLPLKSNPHMHLLEAALAWIEAADGARLHRWVELARDIMRLCLSRFISRRTGALREYFDSGWQPMAGEPGRIVEPGHQFEWAWLLMRWAASGYCDVAEREACYGSARQLIEVGERFGVDPVRNVVFNELWDDMSCKDAAAKLWPQTERIKAWCAMLERASSVQEEELACEKISLAIKGLWSYLDTEPRGLWQEVMLPDGSFITGPSKASSLYHIACATEMLHRTLSARPGLVV